jgi:hypothetical protein
MAALTTPASETIASAEAQSDYGSDIDEETITVLFNELESVSVKPLVLEDIEEHELEQCLLHIPLFSSQGSTKTESTHYYSAVEEQLLEEAGTQLRGSQGRSIGSRTSSTCMFEPIVRSIVTNMLIVCSSTEHHYHRGSSGFGVRGGERGRDTGHSIAPRTLQKASSETFIGNRHCISCMV